MIGILTLFHNNYNWGGMLQGFALKATIEKFIKKNTLEFVSKRELVPW